MILQLITIISDNDYITDDRDNKNNNNALAQNLV